MVSAESSSSSGTQRVLRRANSNTIKDKFLVGYQGWFTCAGDGEPVGPGHHGWLHWFDKPIPDGGRPNVDIWPDVSSYDPSELYQAPGLKLKNGEPAMLFSSRNAQTVKRHFHWMAEHGVDGAFLQRFAGQCDLGVGNEGIRRIRDEVGDRVREAAEQENRVFAIMYDVTDVPADRIQRVLEHDWAHLVHNKRILDSPSYLKEQGRPVVALWGFGFEHAGHTPHLVRSIAQFFRNATAGGVYLMAGTPTHWRTAEGDADRNPEFIDVWLNEFDAISPWTIGRYRTEEEAEAFCEHKMRADANLIAQRNEDSRSLRRIDYIPVVFPGGSGFHLSEGKWAFNDAPRKGGRFLWKQVFNARSVGARIIYGAMWDEYDEGTAFMPAVVHKRNLPVSDKWTFLSLDHGGHDVTSDWYMRICGFAAEVFRGERRIFDSFPSKELQDYWSSRPKYEEVPIHQAAAGPSAIGGASSGAGSSSGGGAKDDGGQSYEDWLASQKTNEEGEAPPPPYTMEAEELESAAPATQTPAAPPAVSSSAASAPISNVVTAAAAMAASGAGAHQYVPPATSGPPPVAHQIHPQGYGPHTQSTLPPTGPTPPLVNQQSRPQNYRPQPSNTLPPGSNVSDLANDFNRINISGPSGNQAPSQGYTGLPGNHTYDPGRMTASPPPLHPTHPAAPINQVIGQSFAPPPPLHPTHPSAQGYGQQSSYGRPPSRPQTQPTTPTGFPSRPPSQGRPTGGPTQLSTTAAPPLPSSNSAAQSQGQWPPPEWGSQRPSQTPQGGPTNQAPPSQYGQTGGANLSRPNTFSANSYGPSNPLRPSGGTLGPPRPSTTVPHASGAPAPSAPGGVPSASNPSGVSGSTGYGAPPPMQHSFSGPPSTPGYSMPSGPSNPTYPGMPGVPGQHAPHAPYASHQTSSGMHGPPAMSSYQPAYPGGGPGGPSFPSSSYPPAPPSHHSGGGPSPHTSPPISPGPANTSYPISKPSLYSDAPSMPGGQSLYAPHVAQFPSASPAGGDASYFGNNSMPQGHVPPTSSYPMNTGQYDSYGMSMPSSYQSGGSPYAQSPPPGGMPGASGTMGVPAPMPWMSGGSQQQHAGPPPSLPPRPSNYGAGSSSSSSTSSKPQGSMGFGMGTTSGAGASALGLALSAVDKVAGKKTTEQLANLAQSGSKFFNKFTK